MKFRHENGQWRIDERKRGNRKWRKNSIAVYHCRLDWPLAIGNAKFATQNIIFYWICVVSRHFVTFIDIVVNNEPITHIEHLCNVLWCLAMVLTWLIVTTCPFSCVSIYFSNLMFNISLSCFSHMPICLRFVIWSFNRIEAGRQYWILRQAKSNHLIHLSSLRSLFFFPFSIVSFLQKMFVSYKKKHRPFQQIT